MKSDLMAGNRLMAMVAACGLFVLGLAPVATAAPVAQPAGDRSQTVITIGYVDWAEDVAVTHLMKTLLQEHFGYRVKLVKTDVASVFRGVASGKIDAFLDVWLPHVHASYWHEYRHQVVDLGPWYQGSATLGIAVPDYVEARSIADLKGQAGKYGGKIYGIERGAGIMRKVRDKVIPGYGLGGYRLVEEPTADMIEALDDAIEERRPFIFTAWKPHWVFTAYPVRYLADPKNSLDGKDRLHVIVRKGLKNDAPVAYRLLDGFQLNASQLGSLELEIDDARSAYGGVHVWLQSHRRVVGAWLADAGEGRRGQSF